MCRKEKGSFQWFSLTALIIKAPSCWRLCAWGRKSYLNLPRKHNPSDCVQLAWSLVGSRTQESVPYLKLCRCREGRLTCPHGSGEGSLVHGMVLTVICISAGLRIARCSSLSPGIRLASVRCWSLQMTYSWPASAWPGAGRLLFADWAPHWPLLDLHVLSFSSMSLSNTGLECLFWGLCYGSVWHQPCQHCSSPVGCQWSASFCVTHWILWIPFMLPGGKVSLRTLCSLSAREYPVKWLSPTVL